MTMTKMIVRAASRMVKAISLGCLLALRPLDQDDHAIEEALAGMEVICTLIWSESTLVPPVTRCGRRRSRGSPARTHR